MSSFSVTFENVLLALLYLLPGYLLCRFRKVQAQQLSIVSVILLYICAPCMFVNALLPLTTAAELNLSMGLFFAVSLLVQILFMLVLKLVFRRRQGEFRFRMLNAASVMGNVGFFGLPVIMALFPDAPAAGAYSCVYCVTMNILAWTLGVSILTGNRRYVSLRAAFLNPTVLSVAVGFILYLTGAKNWMPSLLTGGIRTVGSMTTPLCMFILGIRLAAMDLRKLFTAVFVWGVSLSKLILFPLFGFVLSLLLPVDPVFRASVLILSGTPCASILLNLAEIHGNGQDLAAGCALLSTLLSIFTLPLLSLLL